MIIRIFRVLILILIIFEFSLIFFKSSAFAGKKKKYRKEAVAITSGSVVLTSLKNSLLIAEPALVARSEAEEILYQLQESRNVLNDTSGQHHRCDSETQDPVEIKENLIESQQRILCTGKASLKKFCTEFLNGLMTGGVLGVVTQIAAAQCTGLVLGSDATNGNQLVVNGVQQAINTALSAAITGIYTAWTKCALTPSEGMAEIYKIMKKSSKAQLEAMPFDIKNRVRAIDGQIDQYISQLVYGSATSFDEIVKRLRRRELVYMLFNTQIRDISRNSLKISDEDKSRIDSEFNKILDDYPEHRDSLKVVLTRIRDNSSETHTPDPKTVQFYLYGPPGTGKTTIAERIANATGQYYCWIPTKDLTLSDLTGAGLHFDNWFQQTDEMLLGKIGDCIRRANGRGILFNFDEIGEMLGDENDKFHI